MDRIDAAATSSVTDTAPGTSPSGLGSTFRALAEGTSTERRRRSLRRTARTGRGLPTPARRSAASADAAGSTDSGSWRLAL